MNKIIKPFKYNFLYKGNSYLGNNKSVSLKIVAGQKSFSPSPTKNKFL
jgi:hypothetical protein